MSEDIQTQSSIATTAVDGVRSVYVTARREMIAVPTVR